MWFRNLSLYVVPGFPLSASQLNVALERGKFEPGPDYMELAYGWIKTRGDGYAYELDGHFLLELKLTKRTVPGAVLKQEVAKRIEDFTRANGRKPGKKMRSELKEDALAALLPQAFPVPKTVRVWLCPKAGLMAVDTSSQKTADMVSAAFIRSLEMPLNMRPLKFETLPGVAMTQWVAGSPPDFLTIDHETTFSATGASKATIKFSNTALADDDARRQIDAGKFVSSLAMTFDDGLSFVLKASGAVRQLKPVGVLSEKPKEDDEDTFASDFLLMAGTLADFVGTLAEALGGIREPDQLDLPEPDPESDDDLYEQARMIVLSQNKASVSLVQRHLRIGYNRAARLLEEMETNGVVSAMNSSGNRIIIRGVTA